MRQNKSITIRISGKMNKNSSIKKINKTGNAQNEVKHGQLTSSGMNRSSRVKSSLALPKNRK